MKLNLPKKIIVWVGLVVVAGGMTIAGLFATAHIVSTYVTYEYTSNAMVYIARNQNMLLVTEQGSVYQDLLSCKEVATDFARFISSEGGFYKLQERIGEELPWLKVHSYDLDKHFIEATNENQSRIINIAVKCDNPYDAARIANECVLILQELNNILFENNMIQVVKNAEAVTKPSFPDRKMIIPLGVGIGFVVGVGIDILLWFLLLYRPRKKDEVFADIVEELEILETLETNES